jgi:hypothetical protein
MRWRVAGANRRVRGNLFQVLIFPSDANLSGIIFHEVNAGLLKSFLYFEDRGKISFHDPLVLFDASNRPRLREKLLTELGNITSADLATAWAR